MLPVAIRAEQGQYAEQLKMLPAHDIGPTANVALPLVCGENASLRSARSEGAMGDYPSGRLQLFRHAHRANGTGLPTRPLDQEAIRAAIIPTVSRPTTVRITLANR